MDIQTRTVSSDRSHLSEDKRRPQRKHVQSNLKDARKGEELRPISPEDRVKSEP
jgi:hypothetical protein